MCNRLMAIGSPPITWDLKHTGELWVYIGTPLSNPSGNIGVMVCVILFSIIYERIYRHFGEYWRDGLLCYVMLKNK